MVSDRVVFVRRVDVVDVDGIQVEIRSQALRG
jgi:hypothetical protein